VSKSGNWEKLEAEAVISIKNPFDQIYQYYRAVQNRINHSHFPKEIKILVTSLVCFSQISGKGEIAEKIKECCPQKTQTCFKETLTRNEKFKEYLSDLLPLNLVIDTENFVRLRSNLIPTCRLPTRGQTNLDEYITPEARVKLLDIEQEKLARKLGDGHRLIFGVAGSGKTVVLIARARYLALQHPDWKILILCYNKLLKTSLFHLLNPQDYEPDITISTFHSWARQYFLGANNEFTKLYNEAERKAKKEEKMSEFFHDFVPNLFLDLLTDLGEKKVLYDAILIDEAQDFESEWFKAIIEVLNPKTNSLLITCDGLQGIYNRKKFHWSSAGIQARGRVQKFTKSYRTPIEIGILAQKALPNTLRDLLDKSDEFLSTQEFAGVEGTYEIILAKSREEEYQKLADKIARMLKQPQELLVLFVYNMEKINYEHPFFKELEKRGIEWQKLEDYNYEKPGLLIGTIHGTKGLECDTIIIPEVNKYNTNSKRQLLYVAMTRSKKRLILSAHKSTLLIKNFEGNQKEEEQKSNDIEYIWD